MCLNGAGRYGDVYSDGVTILTTPPNASLAYSIITSAEMTLYDIIPSYLPSNSLVLTWGGFADSAGTPLEYEVRVTNVSSGVGVWENVGFLRQLTLNDIELPSNDSSHVIQVRAVNPVGLLSEVISEEFYILTTPPANSSELKAPFPHTHMLILSIDSRVTVLLYRLIDPSLVMRACL